MKNFYPTNHQAGSMKFLIEGNQLMLHNIEKGSPCAKLMDWHSRLKGAWLILVNGELVQTVEDFDNIFNKCLNSGLIKCMLLFSHPYICHPQTGQ